MSQDGSAKLPTGPALGASDSAGPRRSEPNGLAITGPGRSRVSLVDQSLEYWESIRGDRSAPMRDDFDPTEIPRLLSHVVFLEVVDKGADFRFRVIGDAVRSASFANHTGQLVGNLPHISPDGPLMTTLRDAVTSRGPVRTPIPYEGPRSEMALRDHLVLPLTDTDGQVSHLLLTVDLIDTRRH